jgi:hypothetical protein
MENIEVSSIPEVSERLGRPDGIVFHGKKSELKWPKYP